MSFARQNAFIAAFLFLHSLTFVSEAPVRPFMAYDMYARREVPTLRFERVTAESKLLGIEASRHFRYYPFAVFSLVRAVLEVNGTSMRVGEFR